MPAAAPRKAAAKAAKKKASKFTIDCSKPVEDKIMDVRFLVVVERARRRRGREFSAAVAAAAARGGGGPTSAPPPPPPSKSKTRARPPPRRSRRPPSRRLRAEATSPPKQGTHSLTPAAHAFPLSPPSLFSLSPSSQIASFEKFLTDRIKVNGKAGVLGDAVSVKREKSTVAVTAEGVSMSKRYVKYLAKKFLKKHGVRDWLRVVAAPKDRGAYELRYFQIQADEDEEEEGEE
jgi:large subunit ribosomal protein L22e